MPRVRKLDPTVSPLHFFGAEVRRAREAAGMTLAEFGALVPCDASRVSRIEAGLLMPDDAFAVAADRAFPKAGAGSGGSMRHKGTGILPRTRPRSATSWPTSQTRRRCTFLSTR